MLQGVLVGHVAVYAGVGSSGGEKTNCQSAMFTFLKAINENPFPRPVSLVSLPFPFLTFSLCYATCIKYPLLLLQGQSQSTAMFSVQLQREPVSSSSESCFSFIPFTLSFRNS